MGVRAVNRENLADHVMGRRSVRAGAYGSLRVVSRKRLDRRLETVEELLASGLPGHVVARRVSEQFEVGLRQGQKYVERVIRRWGELEIEERPNRKMMLRRKADALFRQCYQTGQLGAAVRTLDLMGRLDGLFAQPNHLGNVAVESRYLDIKAMNPSERRERIRELIIRAIRAEPEFAAAAREALATLPDR